MVIPNMDSRFLLLIAAVFLGVWAIARAMRTQRFSLKNKVALITGGSRGLGLVLARQICGEGGNVALIARDADELARAKADLVRRGGRDQLWRARVRQRREQSAPRCRPRRKFVAQAPNRARANRP